MKKIVVAIISIALLGGIVFGMKSCLKKKDEIGLKVKTAAVQRGDLIIKITETGSVQPKTTVEIKSNVGGEIVRLPVKEGDWVRKGDLLVELDTTNLKNKLSQAKADLESVKAKLSTLLAGERPQEIAKARESLRQAEINLEDAKIKLDRQNGLFSQGFISKQDRDTAQREYELAQSSCNTASEQLSLILEGAREQDIVSAKASVLKAEVSYEQAASDVKDAMIYAPFAGTIMEKNVEEGEKVTSGIGNSGGGTVILTIGDLSSMKILTKINEVDITKVKTGQDVEITLDAIRGEKYQGQVADIASLGKIENNIVTYEVTIEILGAGVRINHRDAETQREQGVRSQESEYRIQKSEYRSQNTGVRSQESEYRIQKSEYRRQNTGVRSQESEHKRQEAGGRRQGTGNREQGVGSRRQGAGGRSQKLEVRRQETKVVQGISRTPNPDPRTPNPAFSMEKLKTGMTADVDIITDRKTGVLYVPLEAIATNKGGKETLVLKEGVFVPRKIQTGLQDETRAEIIEGLTEGEEVKLNSLTPKKEKTGSSNSSRPRGIPGMGRR